MYSKYNGSIHDSHVCFLEFDCSVFTIVTFGEQHPKNSPGNSLTHWVYYELSEETL